MGHALSWIEPPTRQIVQIPAPPITADGEGGHQDTMGGRRLVLVPTWIETDGRHRRQRVGENYIHSIEENTNQFEARFARLEQQLAALQQQRHDVRPEEAVTEQLEQLAGGGGDDVATESVGASGGRNGGDTGVGLLTHEHTLP